MQTISKALVEARGLPAAKEKSVGFSQEPGTPFLLLSKHTCYVSSSLFKSSHLSLSITYSPHHPSIHHQLHQAAKSLR